MTTGPKKMPADSDQPVSLRIPRELHQKLQARAAADDRTMAATIRFALRYYLDNSTPERIRYYLENSTAERIDR